MMFFSAASMRSLARTSVPMMRFVGVSPRPVWGQRMGDRALTTISHSPVVRAFMGSPNLPVVWQDVGKRFSLDSGTFCKNAFPPYQEHQNNLLYDLRLMDWILFEFSTFESVEEEVRIAASNALSHASTRISDHIHQAAALSGQCGSSDQEKLDHLLNALKTVIHRVEISQEDIAVGRPLSILLSLREKFFGIHETIEELFLSDDNGLSALTVSDTMRPSLKIR